MIRQAKFLDKLKYWFCPHTKTILSIPSFGDISYGEFRSIPSFNDSEVVHCLMESGKLAKLLIKQRWAINPSDMYFYDVFFIKYVKEKVSH